jgi:hypothetical protein
LRHVANVAMQASFAVAKLVRHVLKQPTKLPLAEPLFLPRVHSCRQAAFARLLAVTQARFGIPQASRHPLAETGEALNTSAIPSTVRMPMWRRFIIGDRSL